MDKKIDVLDRGYVRLISTMGNDLTVVNSARVSYDKASDEINEKDKRLIKFLAKNLHTSPFRHSMLQFEVYAPLLVARQHWKYIVGSDFRDPLTGAWNESSRRYITEEPEFYVIGGDKWRKVPESSKQGSGECLPLEVGAKWTEELAKHYRQCLETYEQAMKDGVCVEQARVFLPAYALYVRYYWTASLQAVTHFINQRLAHDAQKEIQEYARATLSLTQKEFPYSIKELVS
ncbi:FAD-dependent thymidylate synthase [Thermoactinomyces sp. DSM 45892]|uniref:FAD-dependent thymidylate synthase n=1 Tax=Thermoactinomyces sp. DSM 45892 TaxID=1882753 RepID=UPI00089A0B58|nr:FAD-dependent thymidylate synthase [Thermoactinomyces sp. DSM 45892]SDZ06094.1 thymidylate synthase (FAD) [Thermoactinomyces sp. DSM 45892]